jgi:hypothetical protein
MTQDPEKNLCALVAEQLAVALDGPLPATLEAHLDACERCMSLLEEAAELGDAIHRAGDGYHHASDFEARVLAAMELELDPDPDGVEPTRPMRRLRLQL